MLHPSNHVLSAKCLWLWCQALLSSLEWLMQPEDVCITENERKPRLSMPTLAGCCPPVQPEVEKPGVLWNFHRQLSTQTPICHLGPGGLGM